MTPRPTIEAQKKRPPREQTPPEPHHHVPSGAAMRETIESIVVAFVLAFLFRTFEAEAFVIPTGSMAPTLMGRHKDVFCPKCGCPYQVSASEEVQQDNPAHRQTPRLVEAGTCPMCRYTDSLRNATSYSGDRILVGKISYDVSEPRRWDVIVFKYPGEAQTNYIKRLIGLPGETVRIQHGRIWIRPLAEKDRGDAGFTIARKPPQKLLAMLQPVFDNDYMPRIAQYGWPARWFADTPAAGAAWKSDDGAKFHTDGASSDDAWLRYHHLVPSYKQWQDVENHSPRMPQPSSQLIKDFTAYDTGETRSTEPGRYGPEAFMVRGPDEDSQGRYWVGDLAVACTVEAEKADGRFALELCKGGRRFQCRFDLATGRATLSIGGRDMEKWRPSAVTAVRGKGRHDLIFSNCDDQLLLWVDGSVVKFDSPTEYPHLNNSESTESDYAPVGILAVGSPVSVSHLRVLRNIYYIAKREPTMSPEQDHVDFSLESGPSEQDKFFVLGDNSPKSMDGRYWLSQGPEYWVNRDLLLGKAIFIYWPHPLDEIRTPRFNIPFPYFPNFSRMQLVR